MSDKPSIPARRLIRNFEFAVEAKSLLPSASEEDCRKIRAAYTKALAELRAYICRSPTWKRAA